MKLVRIFVIGFAVAIATVPLDLEAQKPLPKGWVGVLITTGVGEQGASGKPVFHDYPVIESIDPGSPAEKAGLQVGDVLIAINAQDFKLDPIPMSDILVPGRVITFRYKRDNVERLTKLTVADRPDGTTPYIRYSVIESVPDAERRRRQTEVMIPRKVVTRAPVPIIVPPISFGNRTLSIAGAELTRLNAGLRELARTKAEGLFVINVLLGTPAEQAGLVGGDVIVKADNEPVVNPGQLLTVMTRAADNSVQLLVLRKNKEKRLTLRW